MTKFWKEKQKNLLPDNFFADRTKNLANDQFLAEKANFWSHDENLAEKAKIKKPHGLGLCDKASSPHFFFLFWISSESKLTHSIFGSPKFQIEWSVNYN